MKLNEYNTVEKPILDWLQELGWTFKTSTELEKLRPDLREPLVLPMLRQSLLKLNPWLSRETEANRVIDRLKQVIADEDNQEFLAWLRGERSIKLQQDKQAQTVRLLDLAEPKANQFIVSNQYRMEGGPTTNPSIRCDVILLVNGLPLVVIEAKSLTASHKDWDEAIRQLNRYQKDFPSLFVSNQLNVAAYELGMKYGATGAKRSEDYAEWKTSQPYIVPKDNRLQIGIFGLLDPSNLLDIVDNFIVFEKRDNHVTKKIARYQQFIATNKIVERVRGGRDKRGLVWHTQGSGKSLTMLFTAWKLRRDPALKNPTVFIVVDRKDLDTQISGTFEACDFPNTARAFNIVDLQARVQADNREVIITTIQKFEEMGEAKLINNRENIIVLVDEAHRSQEEDLGSRLRATFQNAFFFGFTGTPIDRNARNTHRTFGITTEEGKAERYLDYYSIKQAIADGATVPVHYTTRLTSWQLNNVELDKAFDSEFADLTQEERDLLKKENANNRVLVTHPRRIRKIAEDVIDHFRKVIAPNGFKAQLVTFDRRACVLYKAALDLLIGPAASEVIYSPGLNDPDEMRVFHYDKEKQSQIIEKFKNPNDPLQILIVTDMLLTGFDAPIEQAMYLDKPLRDHTLLQAMARTNRPYPNKLHGLIVDYYGVFQNLQKALNFNEDEIEDAVVNIEELRRQFPEVLQEFLDVFNGLTRDGTQASLMACLNRLGETEEIQLRFTATFKKMQLLYETLSPDASLVPHLADYDWACRIIIAYNRRMKREDKLNVSEYGAKTRELIYRDSSVQQIERLIPVYEIDENYLIKIDELVGGWDAQAADMENALKKELTVKAASKPVYQSLSQRLEKLIEERRDNTLTAVEIMKQLKLLVSDYVGAEKEANALGLSEGEDAIFQLVRKYAPDSSVAVPDRALAFVRRTSEKIKTITFNGWQAQNSVRQDVEREITWLCLTDFKDLNLYPGPFISETLPFVIKYF